MSRFWKCPDCGQKYDLKKEREERRKLGILETHPPIPERCHGKTYKGKHYHIAGVAGRFYSLTPKGERAALAMEAFTAIMRGKP